MQMAPQRQAPLLFPSPISQPHRVLQLLALRHQQAKQRTTVAFTAPANTGGAAITTYTVTASPGGITATGNSSPITVYWIDCRNGVYILDHRN